MGLIWILFPDRSCDEILQACINVVRSLDILFDGGELLT